MPSLAYQPEAREVARVGAPHLPGIRVMSPTHDAILECILANPGINLGEVAQVFGVTQSWLSCIIHSDCFQDKLTEAKVELYGDIRTSVKDRISALAQRSLARLQEKIEVEDRIERITDAAEMALKAMGYIGQTNGKPLGGVSAQGNVQVNQYFGSVSAETLAQARSRMMQVAPGVQSDRSNDAPAELPAPHQAPEG